MPIKAIESSSIAERATDKYVVVVPCWGAPYISGVYVKGKTDSNLKLLQQAVMGGIEEIARSDFRIHPMFSQSERRWAIASVLLANRRVKVWVNDNGRNKMGVNTGTIVTPEIRAAQSGCPHIHGDIALVVPKEVFESIKINPRSLFLIKPKLEYERVSDVPSWEFADDAELEEFDSTATQMSWDFNEDNGFCYAMKV